MLVIRLVHNNDIDLVNELQELRELLKKKNITIGLVESDNGNSNLIKIMCDEECYNEKIKGMIYLYVSNILYNIVIEKYRKKELLNFLTETYFFLKQEEIIELEDMIMKVLRSEENLKKEKMVYCISKINTIIEKIKACLEENEEINIKGFITFRMKELREDIEDIIDKVIEEYMVEKEYKEFVKLLKYFVDIQESKIEKINIYIHDGGAYVLKDGFGNDVFTEFINDLSECRIDTEAKIEDIIISGLITNAPKQIIIHHKENCINSEFIETIVNVFEDRVFYCAGCSSCTSSKVKI